jgi:UDP-glucuronate 4-epimerase
MVKKILITGCAGFIGSHTTEFLLKNNYIVYGIDNLNNYYDINIKLNNLKILNKYNNFYFKKEDICDTNIISEIKPDIIIHLASMAGVRYSIINPDVYVKVNINGFIHILQECVKNNINNIIFASSSSVYGLNTKLPFNENDIISTCNSPYACSKMAMELYAKTYSQLYNLHCVGLRFFTVYGSRGRPDMAPDKFLKAIDKNEPIDKFGDGTSMRDYTFIDDIVNGIYSVMINIEKFKYEVFNLGNSTPIKLNNFINICENIIGKKAIINQIDNQLGDVPNTYADINKAKKYLNYNPQISLEEGLKRTYKYIKDNEKLITINLSYYNQSKEVLIRHLEYWKTFENKNNFTFFIIDDCSKISVKELLNEYNFEDLDIHLYRVEEDLYCNIAGVRNLGAMECITPYILILDMDTIIDNIMSKELIKLVNSNIDNNNVFKFNRKVLNNINHIKHNQMHPAICLIRVKDYWNIGGCEEDLVGHYGYTDPCFWERSKNKVNIIYKNDIYLQYYPDGESDIIRNTDFNKKIFEEKKNKNNWSNKYIRFKWSKININ